MNAADKVWSVFFTHLWGETDSIRFRSPQHNEPGTTKNDTRPTAKNVFPGRHCCLCSCNGAVAKPLWVAQDLVLVRFVHLSPSRQGLNLEQATGTSRTSHNSESHKGRATATQFSVGEVASYFILLGVFCVTFRSQCSVKK